jgi:hypothetical protein
MRQIMPHRNNIGARARSCKSFLPPIRGLLSSALAAGAQVRVVVAADFEIRCINSASYVVDLLFKGRPRHCKRGWLICGKGMAPGAILGMKCDRRGLRRLR